MQTVVLKPFFWDSVVLKLRAKHTCITDGAATKLPSEVTSKLLLGLSGTQVLLMVLDCYHTKTKDGANQLLSLNLKLKLYCFRKPNISVPLLEASTKPNLTEIHRSKEITLNWTELMSYVVTALKVVSEITQEQGCTKCFFEFHKRIQIETEKPENLITTSHHHQK